MLVTDDAAVEQADEELSFDAPGSPSDETSDSSAAVEEQDPRERDLLNRLAQSGREVKEARDAANAAANLVQQQQQQIAQLNAQLQGVMGTLTQQQQAEQQARQAARQKYLDDLPPELRALEELNDIRAQLADIQTQRVAAAQPARVPPPVSPQPTADPDVDYTNRRIAEIVANANREFGTQLSVDDVQKGMSETGWQNEESFMRETYRMAAEHGATPPVATKNQETPAEMEARIRAEVRAEQAKKAGGTTAAPRPAGSRGKAPSDTDVRDAVSTYDSKLGPKANLARINQLRKQLGTA